MAGAKHVSRLSAPNGHDEAVHDVPTAPHAEALGQPPEAEQYPFKLLAWVIIKPCTADKNKKILIQNINVREPTWCMTLADDKTTKLSE